MKLFGKFKVTAEDLERQAAQELESAVAQAKPPTEAERTWVLPMDEEPEVPPRPRPEPTRVRAGLFPPPEEEEAEPPARPSRRTGSAAGSRPTARRPAPAQTGAGAGGAKAASRAKAASPKRAATRTAKTGR